MKEAQSEKTVNVEVACDPESGMSFNRRGMHGKHWDHARRVAVPESTLARWEAAKAAWSASCEEMYNYLVEAGGRGW